MSGGFGAVPVDGGVRFRLWAPTDAPVELRVRRRELPAESFQLPAASLPLDAGIGQPEAGVRELIVPHARPGDRYAYAIDGGELRPDPASRYQPDGVHGWSEIVDPASFAWTDADWRGLDPRRSVIYELHVGTFTPEGTFRGAMAQLPYLHELGVTAIELMPVADFAGCRNWGYDGVALFAPSRVYGRPEDLRAFVDAAHAHDLAVIVDVVYNHLGPEGAYLPSFSPRFLTSSHQTPWGDAVNLDDRGSATVRALLIDNAVHWVREYHADGLRLDAVHALIDQSPAPFVAELAAAVHRIPGRRAIVYAEDSRNLSAIVTDPARGGWGLDGVWADDFHHVVRAAIARDRHGYYVDYEGTAEELARTLRDGWLYIGQHSRHQDAPRGTDASDVELRKAVICVQNHDQIGNRALGDRLHHTADPAAWRAVVTILLTAPMTPLLFMGQEWSASTPFQFFTDFEPSLGRAVVTGRREEFQSFPEFSTPAAAARIPDPQSEQTFLDSRLRRDEIAEPAHARAVALHRDLLHLRRRYPSLQASDACRCEARALDDNTVAFRRAEGHDSLFLVVARLRGNGSVDVQELREQRWEVVLTTEDGAFTPDALPPQVSAIDGTISFRRAGALIFKKEIAGESARTGARGATPLG